MYLFGSFVAMVEYSAKLYYRGPIFWSNFKCWLGQQNFRLYDIDPKILLKYLFRLLIMKITIYNLFFLYRNILTIVLQTHMIH